MGIEIERKFLVDEEKFKAIRILRPITSSLVQAYISFIPCVRIRIKGSLEDPREGWFTVKGPGTIVREEFELRIPRGDLEEACRMVKSIRRGAIIQKTRYRFQSCSEIWEVDQFHGDLEGLWLAEVELDGPEREIELPNWVGKEVTHDVRYSNMNLANSGKVPPPPC